jgi:putative ABC transport system ATP-binding protein
MIRIENISKTYQKGTQTVCALREVSLDIPAGSFYALVGRSGSGKSTLLQMIGGLDRPTGGHVSIKFPEEEKDLAALSRDNLALYRRWHVGFIFQSFHLLPTLTVLENILIPAVPEKYRWREKHAFALELLRQFELKERAEHLPAELSGGEQQRVAIARALINDPDVILADEPTGELDTQTAAVIVGLLKKLNSEGKTIVLATHDLGLARQAAKLVHLEDGKIVRMERNPATTTRSKDAP